MSVAVKADQATSAEIHVRTILRFTLSESAHASMSRLERSLTVPLGSAKPVATLH
jgi:hypothetical protein